LPRPSALADLDEEAVRARIRSHHGALKSCYERQLLHKPALRGTVSTRFLITPTGTVAALEVSGLDPDVSSCVADTLRTIEFPRSGSSVQVSYPFHFRRTGSDVE
jgi:hypothetical protein